MPNKEISFVLAGALFLLGGVALASPENNGRLVLSPSTVAGMLVPFSLEVDGKAIAKEPGFVKGIKINGKRLQTGLGPNYPFFYKTEEDHLEIMGIERSGSEKKLVSITLPQLDSIQIVSDKKLVFNVTGDISEVKIDQTKITVESGKGMLHESPFWFTYNHVVKLQTTDGSPGRTYNLRVYKSSEIAQLQTQGVKPAEKQSSVKCDNMSASEMSEQGELFLDEQEFDKALGCFRKSRELDEKMLANWFFEIRTLRMMKKPDEAKQTAKALLGRHPELATLPMFVAMFPNGPM